MLLTHKKFEILALHKIRWRKKVITQLQEYIIINSGNYRNILSAGSAVSNQVKKSILNK